MQYRKLQQYTYGTTTPQEHHTSIVLLESSYTVYIIPGSTIQYSDYTTIGECLINYVVEF